MYKNKHPEETATPKMYTWKYNEVDFFTSRHKITQDELTCHKNQSINQSIHPADQYLLWIRVKTLCSCLSLRIQVQEKKKERKKKILSKYIFSIVWKNATRSISRLEDEATETFKKFYLGHKLLGGIRHFRIAERLWKINPILIDS